MGDHLRSWRAIALAAGLLALASLGLPIRASAEDFSAIDRHARAAPPSAERSVRSLAQYLSDSAHNDRERARAVFTWIATNITYDLSCLKDPPSATSVLKERRAVCAGYAALFRALADAAGLQAVIIRGEAKGLAPGAARSSDGLFYHDWNAVKMDGRWMLVDCSWGAGRLNERGRFVARFDDHYFLAPPEMLVYDHLPQEAKWQLLEHPLSRQEFLRQAEVHPDFFDYDLRLVSHPQGYIEAVGPVTITIGAPPDVNLMASLLRNGVELPEGHTFAQRGPQGYQIRAILPKPGDYRLRVHARRSDSDDEHYLSVVDYHIHAVAGDNSTFPKLYLSFQERGCVIQEPLSGLLRAGRPVEFRLSAPDAEDVLVLCNRSATHLASHGEGVFAGTVTLEPGEAVVFARYPGETRHVGLLRYVVKR
jgi:hypothetical protein